VKKNCKKHTKLKVKVIKTEASTKVITKMSLCGAKCAVPFNDKDEIVTCGGSCKAKFHQHCSLLNKAAYEMVLKNSSVTYRCIKCQAEEGTIMSLLEKVRLQLSKIERKNDEQFSMIDKRFSGIEKGMVEGEKQVRQDITKVSKVIDECNQNSWTEVVKQKKKKNSTSVVHIAPTDKSVKSDATKTAIKNVLNAADFSVKSIMNASNGSVLIECDNECGSSALLAQATLKLSDKFEVKKPSKRLPRIKMLKIKDAIENDDDFLTDLKVNNPFIGDQIELVKREDVKIRGKKIENLCNVVLQLDGESYNKVMTSGKLLTGWESVRVVDNIYIRRCYKCYGFNHNAAECKHDAVCSRCTSTEHNYKACEAAGEKCINCIKTNAHLKTHLDVNHSVWSRECLVYKKKLEISKRGIQYID
jgi:hypothetical protein